MSTRRKKTEAKRFVRAFAAHMRAYRCVGYALAVLALASCSALGIGIDKQLAAQNAVNVRVIADDNADLAAKAKLDPVSAKIYADHAASAVKVAEELAK